MAKVKVYSTPTCIWCKKTKEWLAENKIDFESLDVSADKKLADEMLKKSGQMSVPVIEIEGAIILGFDVNAMKKALKIK